jgi:hypothetical protein
VDHIIAITIPLPGTAVVVGNILPFDPIAIGTAVGLWFADHLVFDVIAEALGMSALITLGVSRFFDALKSRREKIEFIGIVFIGLVMAISSFGNRNQRPELYFIPISEGVEAAANEQGGQDGSNVFVECVITNRGTVQTVETSIELTANIGGKIYNGISQLLTHEVTLKIGDKTKTYNTTMDALGRHAVLFVGVPVTGILVFHFPELPPDRFSGLVRYHFKIYDSFGNSYVVDDDAHGELQPPNPFH